MTFDATGLLVFLLAIVPGFVAQQSRHSIHPRSVQPKSVIEETGEYVLNSVFIHVPLLVIFRLLLSFCNPSILATLNTAIEQSKLLRWGWEHHYLVLFYYLLSLVAGVFLGLLRGTLSLNQPVRTFLVGRAWIKGFLSRIGIFSFLWEEPVWYGVLRQRKPDERTFVQVKMRENGGFYTGELRNFAILSDSERQKDFYLTNVHFRKTDQDEYTRLDVDGILLNFSDADSIQVIKRPAPM